MPSIGTSFDKEARSSSYRGFRQTGIGGSDIFLWPIALEASMFEGARECRRWNTPTKHEYRRISIALVYTTYGLMGILGTILIVLLVLALLGGGISLGR